MATYPAYSQHRSSIARMRDDIKIDRAMNGSARARAFYTSPKYDFEVVHAALNATQRDALNAFYLANRLLTVDFASGQTGLTHSVNMDGPPEFMPLGAGLYAARIKLIER